MISNIRLQNHTTLEKVPTMLKIMTSISYNKIFIICRNNMFSPYNFTMKFESLL